MILIVGLGNPGAEYAQHRHNIGFMIVDQIAAQYNLGPFTVRFHGLLAKGMLVGCPILLLKPQTFMNNSGRSVAAAMQFYKLAAADIIIIHDELDLSLGRIRIKAGGGHGGHNGLRDIHLKIGSDYRRLRVGIGHPGDKKLVTSYVLNPFAKDEWNWLDPFLDVVVNSVPILVSGDAVGFMNQVCVRTTALQPTYENQIEP